MTATDVATLVTPGVILDRRTQDELQPPCEVPQLVCWCLVCGGKATGFHQCSRSATVIMRARCRGCSFALTSLFCDEHTADASADALSDGPCAQCDLAAPYIVSTEPLR